MRPAFTDWQRRPVPFALALAAVNVLGLVGMLADDGAWKGAGFLCAVLPSLLAAIHYLRHRRRRLS